MNRSLCWGLLMVISTVKGMPANPFQQQISPCEKLTAQLTSWVLRGVMSSPTANIALMLSPQGSWQRVRADSELFQAVHIENVGAGFVVAKINPACQPPYYRWEIKRDLYAKDANTAAGAVSSPRQSGR
ncbi:DUF2531 family protein [Buttiauxella warmboldiae]|uniref:DUF2531 family protein n=1 Tax=Buttiauxella warmboldiae TaxID=82993 RepID=A0A3N5DJ77_9ENTR|nr:HofP DNA utilization family protein [Buttiauxella warmboldiae]RPH28735.1 DUF2531 family protein [Buttiauxella warmboldiae]